MMSEMIFKYSIFLGLSINGCFLMQIQLERKIRFNIYTGNCMVSSAINDKFNEW